MIVEIKVPTPGESINEVEIASWNVKDGDIVTKNQELAEIESDKASLSIVATESGKIKIIIPVGNGVNVNSVACTIDTAFASEVTEIKVVTPTEKPKAEVVEVSRKEENATVSDELKNVKISPVAKAIMDDNKLSVEDIINGLKRISKEEVEAVVGASKVVIKKETQPRAESRQKMTSLRKKLSARLVAVKNETAMLTTFNEVDVTKIKEIRAKYGSEFEKKFGTKLGFMSFFIKASAVALTQFPVVNSMIDGEEIVTPNYVDIAVAVSTPKGLMVPVIRDVANLSLGQIEIELKNLAIKARDGKLSLAEMTGGTFTVTNGGVFGSMLSTPIINPPQSAILGMHNIVDRAVVVDGKIVVRPIMYLALSYDHRIIDGKDSVGSLVRIKELLENPIKLLLEGKDPDKLLLEL